MLFCREPTEFPFSSKRNTHKKMNDEKGGPETSAPKETLASLFFLFLEIFVLNLIFFVCFLMPDSRFLSPVFFGGMLFLSLAIFAAAWRRNRKIKKFLLS